MCKKSDKNIPTPVVFGEFRVGEDAAQLEGTRIKWLVDDRDPVSPGKPLIQVIGGPKPMVLMVDYSGTVCSRQLADGDRISSNTIFAILRPAAAGPCRGECVYSETRPIFASIKHKPPESKQYLSNQAAIYRETPEPTSVGDAHNRIEPSDDEEGEPVAFDKHEPDLSPAEIAKLVQEKTLRIEDQLKADRADAVAEHKETARFIAEIRSNLEKIRSKQDRIDQTHRQNS